MAFLSDDTGTMFVNVDRIESVRIAEQGDGTWRVNVVMSGRPDVQTLRSGLTEEEARQVVNSL